MRAEVVRSRAIREAILRLVNNAYIGCPDVGVMACHIYEGFTTGRVRYTQTEIDAELIDLADENLITIENAASVAPIPDKLYKITGRGRDFVRARFPWGRIDEFTGKDKIA
jgi:hypothetical protein